MILLVTDLARGLCMLAIALLVATDGPVLGIVALAVLAACFSTFFYPAIGAYIPSLVDDERQLGPANSAWASLDNLGFIIGPAIGGLLVATGGVTFAFLINAATFVVIAVVLWGLPPSRGGAAAPSAVPEAAPVAVADVAAAAGSAAAPPATEPAAPAAAAGSAPPRPAAPATLRSAARPIAGVLVIDLVGGVFAGGLGVLTVVLATDILAAGEAATGYLNAAVGIGGLVGAIASGVLILRRSLGLPLVIGVACLATGFALLGVSTTLLLAMTAITIVSAGVIGLDVIETTILQRVAPDAVLGRAVGIRMTVGTLAEAIGSFALPVAVVALGAMPVLGAGAVLVAVAGAAAFVLIGPAANREPSAFEATLARVAQLPLFAGVPAARLEGALRQLRARPVAAGEVVVRQGDPADTFYIIEAGEFVVSQVDDDGAERELRRLGPDAVFGELGLLHGSPRTATVAAVADGMLFALDGEDFLTLVGAGSGVGLRGRLLGLYAGSSSAPR
jgi:ENTS family enterobactin (siderophore) exporter